MKLKILVIYASRAGSTQGVAQAIAEELVKRGVTVDMRFILDVKDVSTYHAVIIGSAIRSGRWLPEAIKFVKIHQRQLRKRPVAYFAVGITLYDNRQESRDKILAALKPVCDWVEPVDIGLFAGAMRSRRLKFLGRLLIKFLRVPEGDYRDFPAIRAWAEQLLTKIQLLIKE
ncbi:MAG: hypothetical protein BWK79_19010 [Beggiatoa sp. IS2]|nr:MAG: hypothetical protein BWK79_19010 [Beggiatoa sp. IS2]